MRKQKTKSIFRTARLDFAKLEKKRIQIERRIASLELNANKILNMQNQLKLVPTGGT